MRDIASIKAAVVAYGADILVSPGMLEEREFIQHGATTVYAHSMNVTIRALIKARRSKKPTDERAMVRGALLHDYFGYDWHDRSAHPGKHATQHARRALERARTHFELGPIEQDVIRAHMFPLNREPKTREGWLVTLADKYCALVETFKRKSTFMYGSDPDEMTRAARAYLAKERS